jgi:hypothetical protein
MQRVRGHYAPPNFLLIMPSSGWAFLSAGLPYRLRERMRSLLRFSHAGTHEALALPALKRAIRVETLSRSAKALLPPHKCGGSSLS